jgi:hypothetical protein
MGKGRMMTEHHVLPKSRGGKLTDDNIIMVEHRLHTAYHNLFANLTPDEILEYLQECWFSGKATLTAEEWRRIKEARREHLKMVVRG